MSNCVLQTMFYAAPIYLFLRVWRASPSSLTVAAPQPEARPMMSAIKCAAAFAGALMVTVTVWTIAQSFTPVHAGPIFYWCGPPGHTHMQVCERDR